MSLGTQLSPRRGAHVTACGTLQPVFVRKVELCRQWVEDVLEEVSGYEDVTHTNIDEVSNTPCDGFIPFTDGGFDGLGYGDMNHAHGSGCVPNAIQPYVDTAIKDAENDWDEQNPDHPISWIYADDDADQLTMPGIEKPREREHWREKWYEFEDDHMREGGTYFYKVRVLFHGEDHRSESGEPEALFCVGINTDFEYGRDYIGWLSCYGKSPHCTKWLWEKTIKIKNLNAKRVESLTRQAIKALGRA